MPEIADPEPITQTKDTRYIALFTKKQHEHAYRSYMVLRLAPRFVVEELNKKFGTTFTPAQFSEYAKNHKWSAKRKKLKEHVLDPKTTQLAKAHVAEVNKQHQEFLDHSARIGVKAMTKAESFIDRAMDARTLVSAVAAAKNGIEVYRKSVGLDGEDGSIKKQTNNIYLNFARGPASPFALKHEPTPVIEAKVELVEPDDDHEDNTTSQT